MSSLSTGNQQTYSMAGRKADTQWSGTFRSLSMNISAVLISTHILATYLSHLFPLADIDKSRLYSYGTVVYSALTVALHPLTVTKIRRQVTTASATSGTGISSEGTSFFSNISQYYRGLGVVVSFAIPARIIYISTLEYSREKVDTYAREVLHRPPSALRSYNKEMLGLLPLVTPLSGGVAGGLAAVSSQLIVVPMDVISQKLMVMNNDVYKKEGSTIKVARSIIHTDGLRGLYKGFGLRYVLYQLHLYIV